MVGSIVIDMDCYVQDFHESMIVEVAVEHYVYFGQLEAHSCAVYDEVVDTVVGTFVDTFVDLDNSVHLYELFDEVVDMVLDTVVDKLVVLECKYYH